MNAVYIDELIAVNVLSDLAVLRITEKLTGRKIGKTVPLFIGSVLGLLAVFFTVPKVLATVLFLLSSLGWKAGGKDAWYLLISAVLLDGIVSAVGGKSFAMFLIATVMTGAAVPAALPRFLRRNAGIRSALICIDKKRTVSLRVMTDTGCTVRDNLCGRGVLIIDRSLILPYLSEAERRSAEDIEHLRPPDEVQLRFYPVPCRTVTGTAYLTGFCPESVILDGIKREDITVCLSQTKIHGPFGCGGMIGENELP